MIGITPELIYATDQASYKLMKPHETLHISPESRWIVCKAVEKVWKTCTCPIVRDMLWNELNRQRSFPNHVGKPAAQDHHFMLRQIASSVRAENKYGGTRRTKLKQGYTKLPRDY